MLLWIQVKRESALVRVDIVDLSQVVRTVGKPTWNPPPCDSPSGNGLRHRLKRRLRSLNPAAAG
jgi:hypothetical protein